MEIEMSGIHSWVAQPALVKTDWNSQSFADFEKLPARYVSQFLS